MEQKPKEGDREFSGRGMASIFGAPDFMDRSLRRVDGRAEHRADDLLSLWRWFRLGRHDRLRPHGWTGPGPMGRRSGRFDRRLDRHVHFARILSAGLDRCDAFRSAPAHLLGPGQAKITARFISPSSCFGSCTISSFPTISRDKRAASARYANPCTCFPSSGDLSDCCSSS